MDRTKPTTQLLGRFQPWHKGHTELFKRAISKTGQVIIQLRETPYDEDNPYSVEERRSMISIALNQSGFVYGEDYEVMGVPNITHITYGREVGYKIEREYLDEKTEGISATDLRDFG
tara:strand:- start:1403 stop:1753 length:351 start_codon:yes stop_codon:yes gene_type:complete